MIGIPLDSVLLYLHNSSDYTQPRPIIANYHFSDIVSTATRANSELPLLQLRAKSGLAFIVLAGKEERSHSGDCWLNITYRYI